MTCQHLVPAEEAVRIEIDGRQSPVTVLLCNWADGGAPAQLVNVPRWLQRNAIAGHLWRQGDCDFCPCHEPRK